MTPVDQTEFSARDESTHGNCMSACLASLLDIPLTGVPNLAELGDDWFKTFIDIVHKQGCTFKGTFMFAAGNDWERLRKLSPGIDGFFIVGGKSPREYVTRGHSVIYSSNGHMVHDPHPSREGLTELEDALMIERVK